jgi:aminomuconate-semialdehyde/2-hydroxymuconate-6-semialdehyde dehydrogenase
MEKIKNYINGELVPPVSNSYIDNFDPSVGKTYSLTPDSDDRDVNKAVEAASKAFPEWSVLPAEKRSQMMLKISDKILNDLEELARAESIDNGKPINLARNVDIPRASLNFKFFAAAILNFFSESHAMEDRAINYTLRNPIGVAGCISPWNLPLYLFTWKIAPALASGNTVVAKPSELTPMTAYLLSKICVECGLPPGVLNIIHGYGNKVGRAISSHDDIPVISFTGGTKTGADIASVASPKFKKLSLELGGKNPVIIFQDRNFDAMIENSVRSSFSNQGEICLCGSRIFIERPLYEKFKQAFLEKTKALRIGNPLDEITDQGAIVSEQHLDKILSYIQLAKEEGGMILWGGERISPEGRTKNGWFVQPTIIEGLAPDCRTNQEEIFGPVVTIMPFDTEEEVLAYANATEYGLASILWTENLTRAHRMAAQLRSGIVWINCWMLRDLRTPFGGMKDSGIGREGGFEALRFFTEPKNVCINLSFE